MGKDIFRFGEFVKSVLRSKETPESLHGNGQSAVCNKKRVELTDLSNYSTTSQKRTLLSRFYCCWLLHKIPDCIYLLLLLHRIYTTIPSRHLLQVPDT